MKGGFCLVFQENPRNVKCGRKRTRKKFYWIEGFVIEVFFVESLEEKKQDFKWMRMEEINGVEMGEGNKRDLW